LPLFGQHFLVDQNILGKIISFADLKKEDRVLEIGPGKGALTRALLEKAGEVLAVEIDRRLQKELDESFRGQNFQLLRGDALRGKHHLNPELEELLEKRKPYKLVSNLPYASGTAILLNLAQSAVAPKKAVVMLQKEVAERLVAPPASKVYGALSVLLANVARARLVHRVSPSCFHPPPKVESALVQIDFFPPRADVPVLQKLLQEAFSQRRKKVGRLLKKGYDLERVGIDPDCRPEDIEAEKWFFLTKTVPGTL
jgi:16S rRNA (adenine1518-N6/adenine1519-N6)-dimethyltransferase